VAQQCGITSKPHSEIPKLKVDLKTRTRETDTVIYTSRGE